MKNALWLLLSITLTFSFMACRKKDTVAATSAPPTACSANCEPGDGVCPACRDNPNCRAKEGGAVPPAGTSSTAAAPGP